MEDSDQMYTNVQHRAMRHFERVAAAHAQSVRHVRSTQCDATAPLDTRQRAREHGRPNASRGRSTATPCHNGQPPQNRCRPMSRRLLVTNALPYANGPLHLGHLLGYIQADVWVRAQRMQGNEAIYVCADDAHGTPIMLAAEKAGLSPENYIEGIRVGHEADFAAFGVAFDH